MSRDRRSLVHRWAAVLVRERVSQVISCVKTDHKSGGNTAVCYQNCLRITRFKGKTMLVSRLN
ncbi:hypothetical protein DPX16_4590 [Anabarilius grahami]|uniref:Uncharacterized protein n=1 Tax=Anabarilius grahami TaxID=495550 RepID=A0A3N0YBY3_ANAGA|nr:hypothetical protein DPX16_4590 [Anabarilius grahami]